MGRIRKLEKRILKLEDTVFWLRQGRKHDRARWNHFLRTGVVRDDAPGWFSMGDVFDDTPMAIQLVTVPYTGQDKDEMDRVWRSYGVGEGKR